MVDTVGEGIGLQTSASFTSTAFLALPYASALGLWSHDWPFPSHCTLVAFTVLESWDTPVVMVPSGIVTGALKTIEDGLLSNGICPWPWAEIEHSDLPKDWNITY